MWLSCLRFLTLSYTLPCKVNIHRTHNTPFQCERNTSSKCLHHLLPNCSLTQAGTKVVFFNKLVITQENEAISVAWYHREISLCSVKMQRIRYIFQFLKHSHHHNLLTLPESIWFLTYEPYFNQTYFECHKTSSNSYLFIVYIKHHFFFVPDKSSYLFNVYPTHDYFWVSHQTVSQLPSGIGQ